tara:strand:+ start:16 stop:582 length:567 start_codon:yes stop_codon:yes gene_type:complete
MAFWNSVADVDPKRNFRFKVQFSELNTEMGDTTGVVWWAKKVGKPNFTVTESKHSFLNHTYYWPGRVEWQEITMTLVDPVTEGAVKGLNTIIQNAGYKIPGQPTQLTSMSKAKSNTSIGTIVITQIDSDGKELEAWTLHAPFIKSIKYGELDYENDELTQIEIGLRYDWAVCTIDGVDQFAEEAGSGG